MVCQDIFTTTANTKVSMKKLLLSIALLSFFTLQALDYNPIQQAIVDRDPDSLAKLLATTPLTFIEKRKYLDLADQIIWDNYLPSMRQIFPKKCVSTGTDALYLLATACTFATACCCSNNLNPLDEKFDLKMGLCVGPMLVSGSLFVTYLVYLICLEAINFSKSGENAIKVKQLLFDI